MKNLLCSAILLFSGLMVWAGPADAGKDIIDGYEVNTDEFDCSKPSGPDSIKAIQYYSLYREYFKQENYKEAMKYWPYVYKNAPAIHVNVIRNGMEYYEMLVETTEDPEKRRIYLDSLLVLYDHRIACYGDEIKWLARKGLDIQKYDSKNLDAVRSIYNTVIEKGGDEAPYFVLKPYFQIMLNDLDDDMVTPQFVLDLKEEISEIVESNADDAKYGDRYVKVLDDIEQIFASNKRVQKLFNCEEMKPVWQQQFKETPDDLNFIKETYLKMRNGCEEDAFTQQLFDKLAEMDPTPGMMLMKASENMKNEDYTKAIKFMEKAIDLEEDQEKIAEYNYKIAEMYYVQKDFPTARTFARKVIRIDPDWGKPYLLIGKLYASSGKLCGPGTGLESQRVIWPALDYFNKAKSVDPSVGAEAQQLINKYWAYLPEKSDIFMQWGKGSGDAYFVPCWIQENTTIRTK